MITNTHTPYPTTTDAPEWLEWARANYATSYAASTLVECYTKTELQAKLNEGLAEFCETLEVLDDMHADVCNA